MGKFEEFELPMQPTKDQQAVRMREAFPESAESIDVMRELFGEGVTVLSVEEGGRSHKTKSYKADSEYSVVMDGADFLRIGNLGKQASNFVERNAGHAKRK